MTINATGPNPAGLMSIEQVTPGPEVIRPFLQDTERVLVGVLNNNEQVLSDAISPTLVMTGATPGLGANESVELLGPHGEQLTADFFTADVPVKIEVDGEGAGINVGPNAKITRSLVINRATAYLDGGNITLDSAGLSAGSGAGATALWTLTLSHDAGPPDRIKLVFATGAGNTHKVNVRVEVSFEEGSPFPT